MEKSPGTRLEWRRSSYSGDTGGECVEVAAGDGGVAVRDSKRGERAYAAVSADAWQAFVDGLIEGSMR
ncbi:DUF397 domain-containing protein [Streptomyces sp. 6N223]|uniref:DUF397 domain-containing protein n=1 Tax=Streptomyces sp. 6N223 TaxID=3457412 RepID=UPI003FD24A6F